MAAPGRPAPVPGASEELVSAFGFLAVDPDRRGDAFALGVFGPLLERGVGSSFFDRRGDAATTRRAAGHVESFLRFCDRVGITDLLTVGADELAHAVERWLAWLASPIDTNDPGLSRGGRTKGLRTQTEPLANVAVHLGAVSDFLIRSGRNDVDLSRAELFVKSHTRTVTKRQAHPIGVDELRRLIAALNDGSVAAALMERSSATSPESAELWCLREAAVLLVSFWAGLRVGERRKLLDDRTVVGVEAVTISMLRTKQHPEGRTLHLWPRAELCPVAALAWFLARCAELGVDRGGLLLPPIALTLWPSIRRGPAENGLRTVADVIGLAAFDLDPTRHYLAGHSLRRGVASALAANGVDLEVIRQHLGHVDVAATVGYCDIVAAGSVDHQELGL